MRVYSLLVATSIVIVAAVPFLAASSEAQPPIASYSLTVNGQTVGVNQVFVPDRILLPQLPIRLTVTFHNNETTMVHTFTMNDENVTVQINTDSVSAGGNATLNFTVLSMQRIRLDNGTEFTPEAEGSGIRFYCIPHETAGMVGSIVLSGAVSEGTTPEKGILLRAYWIGIIGIAATLGWVGISYFVIKSSSRRFTDHREHVRRGLP